MHWNVFRSEFNDNSIVSYDIFTHGSFNADVKQLLKKHTDKNAFSEELRLKLQYYFWSKCEHEVVITSWPPHITKDELNRLNIEFKESAEKYGHEPYSLYVNPDCAEKVDVYEQVMLNWDVFCDYIWSFKKVATKTKS